MGDLDDKVGIAVALLTNSHSPKRRTGAKQLRRLRDPAAGPALLAALLHEVEDPRTWETQYQMVMALGDCLYYPALPYLNTLATRHFTATAVYTALGDAIVRLDRKTENGSTSVLAIMQMGNDMLLDGAFRAMAMLRLQLAEGAVRRIVAFVANRELVDGLRFWVAVAAEYWVGTDVQTFLHDCTKSPWDDVRQASEGALNKMHLRWSHL